MFKPALIFAALLVSVPIAVAQTTSMTVKLLNPISTKTSAIGDRLTAFIEAPPDFKDGTLEGRITKLKAPARGLGKGKPEIAFEFDTLTVKGKTYLISANLKDVTNASGVRGVDDEGRVVGRTSNMKRMMWTAIASGAGAALGGAANGARGAAEGAAAGAVIGFAISVTMTAAGQDVEFRPGSHFMVDVYPRRK